MHGIDVKVSYVGDEQEVAIIDINGYIDTTTAPEVSKVIEQQIALNKNKIIVNLEQVPYISSVGWGTFVGELKDIRDKSGDLVLANMTYDIYNIFELMEFSSILNSFTGVDSAVSYFLGTDAVKTQADVLKEFVKTEKETHSDTPSKVVQDSPIDKPSPKVLSSPSGLTSSKPQASSSVPSPSSSGKAELKKPPPSDKKPSSMLFSLEKASYDINELLSSTHTQLGRNILRVIIDKPYYDVKDIAKALGFSQYGGIKVRKGVVKRELKFMGLDDRQKRYELALKTRPK
jgi:anti-anti-sigma factor